MIWGAVQIGGAVLGAIGRGRGNKKQEKAQKKQADQIRKTTDEAARRLERGQDRKLGETTAGVYASGVGMSGSSEAYVRDMQAEQARELAWLKDAGEQRAKAVEKGASVGRQAGRWQNLGQLGKGISGGVGTIIG
jgi:hypothetical protein